MQKPSTDPAEVNKLLSEIAEAVSVSSDTWNKIATLGAGALAYAERHQKLKRALVESK